MENYLQKLPNDLNTIIQKFSNNSVYYHLFINQNNFDEYPSKLYYCPLGMYTSLDDAIFDLLSYPDMQNKVYNTETKKWTGICHVWPDLYIIESNFGSIKMNEDMVGYRIIDNKLKKFIFIGNGFWYNMVLKRKVVEVEFNWEEPEFFTTFFK